MALLRIRPATAVAAFYPFGRSVAPIVAGTGQQWSDDNDATYAEVHDNYGFGDNSDSWGWVTFPAIPLNTQTEFRLLYRSLSTTSPEPYLRFRLYDDPAGFWLHDGTITSGVGTTEPVWGTWHDPQYPPVSYYWPAETRDAVFSALAAGTLSLAMSVSGVAGTSQVARIYEVALLAEVPAITSPPTRVFPRDDGLATSTAGRVWPPPRSEQGSNRIGPGTYT